MLRGEVKKIAQERREAIKDLLKIMESFLIKSQWFAGDELTVADFSYLANVATIKVNEMMIWVARAAASKKLLDVHRTCSRYLSLSKFVYLT